MRQILLKSQVAPLVGAWIEIVIVKDIITGVLVAPLVGAWIEILQVLLYHTRFQVVAPLVGAWIEIDKSSYSIIRKIVAPLVGAWIEIDYSQGNGKNAWSLLSWERGLK